MDKFYSNPQGGDRIRVSVDEKTQDIVACLVKKKLVHRHIYCPRSEFDVRISVNMEISMPKPSMGGKELLSRRKDRVSYSHQHVQVDLTQVTSMFGEKQHGGLTYELEMEIRDIPRLKQEWENRKQGIQNNYERWIEEFVYGIRALCRIR